MRFEARDLAVHLLPRNEGGEDCTPSPPDGDCTPSPPDGDCTPSPPRNCTPSPPGNCTPSPPGNCTPSPPDGRRTERASLGMLRRQLRQHLSQPGAC